MRGASRLLSLVACAASLGACGEPRPTSSVNAVTPIPATAIVAPTVESTVGPTVAVPSPSASALTAAPSVPCVGKKERQFGSTCCESRGSHEDRFPGQIFLECRGPQIGQQCKKKGDCDVVCFCQDGEAHVDPGTGRGSGSGGPKDGTRGVTGVCGGSLQVGVWMCEIDETGAVTHVIVD